MAKTLKKGQHQYRYDCFDPQTDLTPSMRVRLSKLIEKGIPPTYAASELMIARGTIEKWRARGQELAEYLEVKGELPTGIRDHDRECLAFYRDCELMADRGTSTILKTVLRAAGRVEYWSAAKWLLQIRNPKEFNMPSPKEIEITTAPNGESKVTIYMPDNGRDTRQGKDKSK